METMTAERIEAAWGGAASLEQWEAMEREMELDANLAYERWLEGRERSRAFARRLESVYGSSIRSLLEEGI